MTPPTLLQLATELRRRAAAAELQQKADLLFLAEEYEATARGHTQDKDLRFSVKLPK